MGRPLSVIAGVGLMPVARKNSYVCPAAVGEQGARDKDKEGYL